MSQIFIHKYTALHSWVNINFRKSHFNLSLEFIILYSIFIAQKGNFYYIIFV